MAEMTLARSAIKMVPLNSCTTGRDLSSWRNEALAETIGLLGDDLVFLEEGEDEGKGRVTVNTIIIFSSLTRVLPIS